MSEEDNIFKDMKVSSYIRLTREDWIFILEECKKLTTNLTPAMRRVEDGAIDKAIAGLDCEPDDIIKRNFNRE